MVPFRMPHAKACLAKNRDRRISKSLDSYRRIEAVLTKAWPTVSAKLTEAQRFEAKFLTAVGGDPGGYGMHRLAQSNDSRA